MKLKLIRLSVFFLGVSLCQLIAFRYFDWWVWGLYTFFGNGELTTSRRPQPADSRYEGSQIQSAISRVNEHCDASGFMIQLPNYNTYPVCDCPSSHLTALSAATSLSTTSDDNSAFVKLTHDQSQFPGIGSVK